MKILVDHGVYDNLGDIAMLEGVVGRAAGLLPSAHLAVINRNFASTIWNMSSVTHHPDYEFRMDDPGDPARKLPLLGPKIPGLYARATSPFLGRWLPAGSMTLARKGRSAARKLADFCAEFDGLLISGGGYLTDTFYITLFHKYSLMLAFAEQGKPIMLTGQQLGPFKRQLFKQPLVRALQRVNFVGVREPADSLTFCREAGLPAAQYTLMGDDSFGLSPAEGRQLAAVLQRYGLESNNFLAFNLRIDPFVRDHAQHLGRIARLIDTLAARFQMPACIVPISLNPRGSDVTVGGQIARLVDSAQVVVLEPAHLTAQLVKGLLGQAFGAAGVSYHFCTFALSQGIPAICLYDGQYYSQKAKGLRTFWGDDRLALSLAAATAEQAAGHIGSVWQDPPLRAHLNQQAGQAISTWKTIFDQQLQLIFGN